LAKRMYLNVFTSTSLMRGIYENAVIANGGTNLDISGNQLESVPQVISRNGVNLYYRSFSAGLLGSYVDQTFSDPTNQVIPSANGARGLVPSYFLLDLNLGLQLNTHVKFRLGINNLANLSYFTKRPLFYPGPGIWPSDGRSFNFSVEAKF
jgi:Fe(3+) dicitrate transport protein